MVSVKQNYDVFAIEYDWPEGGDEWSEPWGGAGIYGVYRYSRAYSLFYRPEPFWRLPPVLGDAPGF
jgi:hypothetical protein